MVTNFVVRNVSPIITIKINNFNTSPLIPFMAPNTAHPRINVSRSILPLPNIAVRIPT
jgi:hypothetical protein